MAKHLEAGHVQELTAIAAALNRLDAALGENWRDNAVHMTFGAFMGGLVLLLALLVAGVPIVGS